MKSYPVIRFAVAASLSLLLVFPASAAGPVLATAGNLSVTAEDIQGDALRIPLEQRSAVMKNSDAVQQLSNNLVIRRTVAADAEKAGLSQDPAIQSAIRIARERVLSDMLFARIDAQNKPSRAVVEAIAETNYKANPRRFDLPEEFGASHILIKRDTADAQGKIRAVLAELKAGADFATLARQRSEDSSNKDGGNLGYFVAGQMVGPFDAAVQKMQKPGELSEIVETPFGFHVIKFEGKRAAGVRSYEQVKEVLIREAEAKILTTKRLEYTQKIQDTVKFDKAAIDAFANSAK